MLQFPPWKIGLIWLVVFIGVLYAAPNVTGHFSQWVSLPTWAPGKPVNLGLDLRGGAHILVQVRTDDVLRERLNGTAEALRVEMRNQRVRTGSFNVDEEAHTVSFTIRDATDAENARDGINNAAPGFEVEQTSDTRFSLQLSEATVADINQRTLAQSLEVVTRRVNALGLTEPSIQRQGADRILIQVPGLGDTEELKTILNAQAKLTFHLVDFDRLAEAMQTGRAPPGYQLLPSAETTEDGQPLREYLVTRQAFVSGENLDNAQATFQDGQPVVSFTFDAAGGQRFGRVTQENVGGFLAAVLDNKVVSAPRIQGAILGGSGIITGNFTLAEAQELSLLLRAGALPAQMDTIEERTVGPGLGQDSIEAGEIACLVGLALVVLFVFVTYGRFGLYANIALMLNIVLLLGVLSALGATLTLPGIAGIALTVGMAVDSNVLIFERIREEANNGRPPLNSIEAGFSRALTTIIDANLTTLIAAVLLFAFGSGPIRGFAVTLAIGLVTSMFTAIMVTRYLIVRYVRAKKPTTLPIAAKPQVGGA